MRTIAPSLNRDALAAASSEFHRWLGAALPLLIVACAYWTSGFGYANALLRYAERQVRKLIFARAAARLGPRRPRAKSHARAAPTGFRFAHDHGSALRKLTRGALPKLRKLSAGARIARILNVLANADRFVVRLARRLRRMRADLCLIAVARVRLHRGRRRQRFRRHLIALAFS
jgi:hypothetical protein